MSNPFGPYGNLVASIIAIALIGCALATKLLNIASDPWLENAALIAIGVVFGTQVVQNGVQAKATKALELATTLKSQIGVLETGSGTSIAKSTSLTDRVSVLEDESELQHPSSWQVK
jgi:hypothetical protein